MSTLHNKIVELCASRGIKPGKMCDEISISRSMISDLKARRKESLGAEALLKIANYFEISVEELLGAETKEKPAAKYDELSELKKEAFSLFDELSEDLQKLAVEQMKLLRGLK